MTWRQLAADGLAPAPRGGHALAAVGSSLLLFGGADRRPKGHVNLWQLHLGKGYASWTCISSSFPASGRSGAAVVTVGNRVYVFGGQEPITGICSNEVWELDINTWVWTHLKVKGLQPSARHSCVAACLKDQCMLVFGGAGPQGPLADVWLFNCKTNTWTTPPVKGKPPAAREMAAGGMISPSHLLVYGGRSVDGTVLDDVVVLDTGDDWSWSSSCHTQLQRCAHSLVVLPSQQQKHGAAQQLQQQLLVFGGFSGTAVEGSLWALVPLIQPAEQQQQEEEGKSSNERGPTQANNWTVRQLHAGVDFETSLVPHQQQQSRSDANIVNRNTTTRSSCIADGFCPVPRFAHAAACLPDPGQPDQKMMVVVGGVNPAQDMIDVATWTLS